MSEIVPEPEAAPRHTFGGRSFDRHVFEFELPDPSGLGDPGLGDPAAEPPPPAPPEPAWSPSQEEWEQFTGAVGYLAELEQQRASVYAAPTPNQPPQIDPFAEDYGTQLRQVIREEIAPVYQHQQAEQLAEANEKAMDILGDLASKDGDFDKEVARMRADAFLPEMQSKYGFGPKAAEAALEKAAHTQRQYEQTQRDRYIAEHNNHLSTLSGAPGEPGSTYTQGVQQRTMPDYSKGGSVASRFFGEGRDR